MSLRQLFDNFFDLPIAVLFWYFLISVVFAVCIIFLKLFLEISYERMTEKTVDISDILDVTAESKKQENFQQVSKSIKTLPSDAAIELRKREDFRKKFDFVEIEVPSKHSIQFIKECEWLKSKTGNFPNYHEQSEILKAIEIA